MSNYIVPEGEIQLLNALTGASAILDEEGNIIASNKSWENGERCMHWPGFSTCESNYIEQCKKAVEQGYDNAIRLIFNLRDVIGGTRKKSELTITFKNPGIRWSKISISRFCESPLKVLITCDDVTSQMNTYYNYREKEERYTQHFKHSVSGIILGTPNGIIVDANPSACRILGYSKEELIAGGRSLIVDTENPMHHDMVQVRSKKSLFEGEKVYRHKNGNQIYVDITSVLYRENSDELYILNTFRDITEGKLAQQALDKERRFTQAVLNSVPGLFFVLDSVLNIVLWNQPFLFETGIHEEELSSFPVTSLFAKEDRVWTEKVLQQILKAGKGNFASKVITRHNGKRYFHFYVNSFDDIEESFLVITAIDITDLRTSKNGW